MKKITKAQILEARKVFAELVDSRTRAHAENAHVVEASCRWLERAAKLYGRQRVEREVRTWSGDNTFESGKLWLSYWRRWQAREDAHLIPWEVLSEPHGAPDTLAPVLALAKRVSVESQARARGPVAMPMRPHAAA